MNRKIMDTQAGPLDLHRETVLPEWVDYNGHMNVAYYVLVFDHATDEFLDHIGLDEAYRETHEGSVFVVEAHVTYENEVMEGDEVAVSTQILDADSKRLHIFHRMYKAGNHDGEIIATNELMILHMDMTERRSAPMPEAIRARLLELQKRHAALPRPTQAGRTIGIRRK